MVVRLVISPRDKLSLLPKFTVDLQDGSSFYIRKKLTLLRDKYDVDNLGLRIEGNIWDLIFNYLIVKIMVVARIQKELFHLTSTYTVTVYENTYADLAISLCVLLTMWKCSRIAQNKKHLFKEKQWNNLLQHKFVKCGLISGNQKVTLLNHQLTWFQLTIQPFFGLTQGCHFEKILWWLRDSWKSTYYQLTKGYPYQRYRKR